jgi:glycosyltransferase involved in cell wall biosynthesis
MKICIISLYFPPRVVGGGEYAASLTGETLAKRGFDIDVLTTHPSSPGPFVSNSMTSIPIHEVKNRVHIHRILGVRTPKLGSVKLFAFYVHELFFLQSLFSIVTFVGAAKPDVIHAMNIDSIPASVVAGKITGIPVVATINYHSVTCPKGTRLDAKRKICEFKCSFSSAKICFRGWRGSLFLESLLWSFILRTCIKEVNKIIAISKYVKATLIQQGISPMKIEVIPEIADTVLFRKRVDIEAARKELDLFPPDKVLLYAGAVFDFRKGSEALLKAMARIVKTVPNAKLVITGTVPNKEMKIIEESGLKKNVVVTGFLPRNRLPSIYAAADIIVFPSVWPEPFGLVLTEAMSMEKPIVASRVGGITDIVQNGVNGLLTEPNDVEGLTTSIISLLNDAKLAKRLSEGGKVSVKRYREDAVLKKLTTVYQSLSKTQKKMKIVGG